MVVLSAKSFATCFILFISHPSSLHGHHISPFPHFSTSSPLPAPNFPRRISKQAVSYLSNPTDVFVPRLLVEAQVLVEAKAHIVAVEAVGGEAFLQ